MFYSNSFPEVHGNIEGLTKERALSHHISKPALKWPLIVVALIVTAAIAVGVGVGIWRQREHASHRSSANIECGSRIDRFSWLTFIARRRRKIITPHLLHSISLMIHLLQLCLSPMATGNYFSKTTLVASGVRFGSKQTVSGARARISISARTLRFIPRWSPLTMKGLSFWLVLGVVLGVTRRYWSKSRKSTVLMLADLYVGWAALRFRKPYSCCKYFVYD